MSEIISFELKGKIKKKKNLRLWKLPGKLMQSTTGINYDINIISDMATFKHNVILLMEIYFETFIDYKIGLNVFSVISVGLRRVGFNNLLSGEGLST